MRYTLIFIAIIFTAHFSYGQTFSLQDNETAEMFANRIKPNYTDIAHKVIETKQLDRTKNAIIAFYNKRISEAGRMRLYDDNGHYDIILGYLLLPTTNRNYEKIFIDTIPPGGRDLEIISIFFANADKDTYKELIVLCKNEQRHYDFNGDIYETCIFKYDKDKKKFKYLNVLSETFWGCECENRDGKIEKAKYKTAKQVKVKLKKLGF